MTAPVRRPSVPAAVGENRDRIRTLEAVRPWGPMVLIYSTAPQTIASSTDLSGSTTAIDFDTIYYESPGSDGMLDLAGHPSRIAIVRPGVYLVGGGVSWEPSLATDARLAAVGTTPALLGAGSDNTALNLGDNVNAFKQSGLLFLALDSGMFVHFVVIQTSGAPTDVLDATLGVQWVAPFGGY